MYGQDILCGIPKVPFEIPHKISYPYIERYDFYAALKFQELLDLRAHTCFWNAPLVPYHIVKPLELILIHLGLASANAFSTDSYLAHMG